MKTKGNWTMRMAVILAMGAMLFTGCKPEDPVPPNPPPQGSGGTSTNNVSPYTFTPSNRIKLCPQWIGGDRDFGGHGPVIHTTISLEISGASVLRAHIRYHLKETQADWTEALYDEYLTLYTAPTGKVIDQVVSDVYLDHSYTDSSHGVATISYGLYGIVYKLVSMGDTGGNDVGNCTSDDSYLSVYWNPITVQLRTL